MKLTKVQQRALGKLTDKWESAYELQESLATLDALTDRKLAERKEELGFMFFPHNNILYRLKSEGKG